MSDTINTEELDGLLNLLDNATAKAATAESGDTATTTATPAATSPKTPIKDAIDAVLNAAPRQTAVQSLRQSPVVQSFRKELVDGMIRADSVNQLLRLVNEVVVRLLPIG